MWGKADITVVCILSVDDCGRVVTLFQLGELENAMDALCEANILNNHDSIVWAYLTLVSVKVCTCSMCVRVSHLCTYVDTLDVLSNPTSVW